MSDDNDPSVMLLIPGHVAASRVAPEEARVGLLFCLDGNLILAAGQDALMFRPNAEGWDAIARNAAEMAKLFRDGTLDHIRQRLLEDLRHDLMAHGTPAGHA